MEKSRRLRTFFSPILPMGIASIAAVLEKENMEVKIIDQFANKMPNKKLLENIREYSSDIIGFSCLTSVISNVEILIREIRTFSNALIVLGNIHPTIFADTLLKNKIADVVIRGEGEITTLELVKAVQKKNNFYDIKGISFCVKNSIFYNPDRPLIQDLDTLPYPDWHRFDFRYYKDSPMLNISNEVVLPIAGSRGCSYKCVFCAQDKIYHKPRYRKCKEIIKELEYMYNKFKVKNFGFIDANFPFSIDLGIQFCQELIRSGLHKRIRWVTETRVDLVNEELLVLMKKAGVYLIMFGFETGNSKIMDLSAKKTSLDQARKAMKITKKLKIQTLGLFILGLPGETKETCKETIKFAKELNCDIAKFNIAIPYPGSKFFEEVYKNNNNFIFEPEKFTPWYDWATRRYTPVYVPEAMNAEELIGLQRTAMFQFYVRPKVLLNFLRHKRISLYKLIYGAYILCSKYFLGLLNEFVSKHVKCRLQNYFKI